MSLSAPDPEPDGPRLELPDNQLYHELRSFKKTAYHLEQQRHYASDLAEFEVWLAGGRDPLPEAWPAFGEWCDLVVDHVAAGRKVERIRVFVEPPTPYQEWEQWAGQWNIAAGEVIRYMSETAAHQIGLSSLGPDDWWLLDNKKLLIRSWGPGGERGPLRIVTDPDRVKAAARWWAVAIDSTDIT